MNIYESAEDYLEQILVLLEEKGYARSTDIAEALDVTKPSVSVAMKKLRENGYISMEKGGLYNLTAFSMCAHNGTHIDAPFHFLRDGKTVDALSLAAFVGMAYVAEHQGILSGADAAEMLEKAKQLV